jgi:hypothetical protein
MPKSWLPKKITATPRLVGAWVSITPISHDGFDNIATSWKTRLKIPDQSGKRKEELKRLKKENKRLLMEREIVNPEPVMVPAGSLSNCKPKAAKLVATR